MKAVGVENQEMRDIYDLRVLDAYSVVAPRQRRLFRDEIRFVDVARVASPSGTLLEH